MKILHNVFLEEIKRRIPQETEVVNILADILSLEEESIRKKLKNEIPFTFNEAMIISRQLNISLDLLELDSIPKPESLLKLNLIEYTNPAKRDFALLEDMISILKKLKKVPAAKGGEITNILPQPLYVLHENIFKFFLFKWEYGARKSGKSIPYKDIVIAKKHKKIQKQNVELAKTLDTDYIFDNLIFQYLVNDIKFFYHIGLVTKEELELIKQDLFKVLDQIDTWTRSGYYEETGKKINIYISDVNIDTSYVYLEALNYQFAISKAFILNGITLSQKVTFEELKHWIQSIKLQSVLISGYNERERIKFLKEQYIIIESLSELNINQRD